MDKSAVESEEDIIRYPAYIKYNKGYDDKVTPFSSNYKSSSNENLNKSSKNYMTNKDRMYSEEEETKTPFNFAFEK